jgi:hypothetical protein
VNAAPCVEYAVTRCDTGSGHGRDGVEANTRKRGRLFAGRGLARFEKLRKAPQVLRPSRGRIRRDVLPQEDLTRREDPSRRP